MSDYRELLDRLKAKPAGRNAWTSRCPAHDDRTPSLSLKLADDGRLLWCCQAGCRQDIVTAAIRALGYREEPHDRQECHRERSRTSPPSTLPKARRIWREAGDPRGTIVQTYLKSRG